jgi:hypothetical protein
MKLISIYFSPTARVSFTAMELEFLMACSAHHYDGTCEDAGREGGFLFSLNSWAKHMDSLDHTLTWRQVDTLCKILEMPATAGELKEVELFRRVLRGKLMETMKTLNEKTPEEVVL